ncbi:hypothetical protein EXIGLDRAFT_685238 [Exidia glandulosa HHB12029]|uniref:DUF4185 domain-containing protein n=1 Tax=Exidia glandulosa HHB12029 TaxID=1314781 RepID=A0A165CAU3_EXIGL|nr:hypothetical protein EXIGLDRAFT_685238 [Exidia glandulosa HHB12029]
MSYRSGLIFALAASTAAFAAKCTPKPKVVDPTVSGTPQVLGIVTDPSLNRDSCNSVKFQNRVLWTCRDTQPVGLDGKPTLPIWDTSASWTDLDADGNPAVQPLSNGTNALLMYGANDARQPFFPLLPGECNDNSAGMCPDGTRYALWHDTAPMVASGADGGVLTAYTWVRKSHIKGDFSTDDPDPATTLYKMTYDPNSGHDALPSVSVVDENFWLYGGLPYGAYGNVVKDGIAYLYGKPSNNNIVLAKVPIGSVEDKSQYQYWVNGAWTSTMPSLADSASANIPNVSAGGQGTYYFSDAWNSYVWIGQAGISVSADFFITTAPSPEGPWAQPKQFYSGENGNFMFGAYSLQAHPELVTGGKNEIYLTYTKNDVIDDNVAVYSTPLIKVQWQ